MSEVTEYITLYHNTTNENAIKINKEGIKGGMRLSAYGKGSEAEGAGIWCRNVRTYGNGGATVTFKIDKDDHELMMQNDTDYILYRDVTPDEIIDIDLLISDIPSNRNRTDRINSTVESDIPDAVEDWGKDKLLKVFTEHPNHIAQPYNIERIKHLIETGEKYCKGRIELTEKYDYQNRLNIFNDIKKLNPNAKWKRYRNMPINRMLAIKNYYIKKSNKKDNKDQEDKKDKNVIEPANNNLNKDYDTDESVAAKTDSNKGLEGLQEKKVSGILSKHQFKVSLTEAELSNIQKYYVLKGMQDENSFDIAYNSNRDKLEKFKDEISAGKPNIKMWIEHKDADVNAISKLEEASRNELLAIAKGETITRYNKAPGYKGFSITNIDTTNILRDNTLVVTCQVGKYHDSVQLEDILYWVQITSEKNQNNQVNTKSVAQALSNAIDGMDIKVDCECGDWRYRFAYQATVLDYKYGKPENRPANIRNPKNYGSLCKHLISLLSNKKWLQQVTGTLMDFIEKNIDKVNTFLKVKPGEELTLPNQLARQNAKAGFYSKLFKDANNEDMGDTESDVSNDSVTDNDVTEDETSK